MNLHGDDSIFVKNEPKDEASKQAMNQGDDSDKNAENPSTSGVTTTVKKEFDGIDVAETNAVPNHTTMEIHIKDEPIDETNTSNIDEQSIQVRQQIVPVIKTEIGNNVPVVSNAPLQRPITIQQAAQLQQQSHQQTFATNDQTLILSSRPLRRLTTNGPADGKAGKCRRNEKK